MNPYWGTDFFSFFMTFFSRLFHGFEGGLYSDELQLFTLGGVAISCGVIGPFLVLKRMTMFANALSHTILLGVVGAFLVGRFFWGGALFDGTVLFLGAIFAALLTALWTEGLTRIFRLQEEASVGLVFTFFFALGVVLVTLCTRNVHLGVEVVLGNADVLLPQDAFRAAGLAVLSVGLISLFYRRLQICSFDGAFASTMAIRQGRYHFLLLGLAAMATMGAFRVVGVVLVLAFLVIPYLTAHLFCRKLGKLLFWTPVIGLLESMGGIALSRHFLSAFDLPLSTGGFVVVLMGSVYFAMSLWFDARKRLLV